MSCQIEIQGVTVSYRENIALRDITLSIKERAFCAVIGPNGAGKTTLLTVINGLGTIRRGTVRIFGLPLQNRTVRSIRRRVGYVAQHHSIDPRFPITVREAVMMGRYGKAGLWGALKEHDREICTRVAAFTGLEGLLDRPLGHLSGGEQQKVAIARALAQEPEILLLDEPTSNLDPRAQRELLHLMDRIYRESHVTMVMVTHILRHIPPCCTETVLMKGGNIIGQGPLGETMRQDTLEDLYGCPMTINSTAAGIQAAPELW